MSDKRDIGEPSFWSVDDLTPPMGKQKNKKTVPSAISEEKTCAAEGVRQQNESGYSTAVHAKKGSILVTRDHPGMLLEQVHVSSWPTPYSFFELFRHDALRFLSASFGEAEYEPFFSFMPQYFQLNGKQLRYYLWWRENVRKGILLRPDYSYVLLYIYEILNLPDRIPPAQGVKQLALVWSNYRREYPRLDRYLCEWMADYCMIHGVALPTEYLLPFYGDILQKATLAEFYIDALDQNGLGGRAAYCRAIMEISNTYRFRQSKAINPQNKATFEKHIPGAVTKLIDILLQDEMPEQGEIKHISRDSYAGAVCSYAEKRMLDLSVHPLAIRSDLSRIVTDAVRYSENCVKKGLKLRAGYQSTVLTPKMKGVLDAYFARYFPSAMVEKRVEERKYDEKYDGKRGFSDAEALKIEEASRAVASRLGAVYEEEEIPVSVPKQAKVADKNQSVPEKELKALLSGGYAALCALAAEQGVLAETLVERINAYAVDLYGDILLEQTENGYAIIEDYIEELPDWQEDK
ncbi:MAG: hypothetical protein E7599_03745 [Ruminococcaceae bacterium]|nr:hypothetical protein [Oscillospiraceae bacterium]